MKLDTSPFSRTVAVFFSFLLSFSFSLQIQLLPAPTQFPCLMMNSVVVSYLSVRLSCEALRMHKELRPSWQGSSSALVGSVGIKIITAPMQPLLMLTSLLQWLCYYGQFVLFQRNAHIFSSKKTLITRPLC